MTEPHRPHRIVVAGGGITGLVAARRLAPAGRRGHSRRAGGPAGWPGPHVRLGSRWVDVGAEALHLGAPPGRHLVEELGLVDTVVGSRPGQSWLWTGRGLRALPAGFTPSGPTRLRPVATSGVMSVRGLSRAGLEPIVARRAPSAGAGRGRLSRRVRLRQVRVRGDAALHRPTPGQPPCRRRAPTQPPRLRARPGGRRHPSQVPRTSAPHAVCSFRSPGIPAGAAHVRHVAGGSAHPHRGPA